jgi:hypothetical protein
MAILVRWCCVLALKGLAKTRCPSLSFLPFSDVIAFKAVVPGDAAAAAASLRDTTGPDGPYILGRVKASAMASGAYTFWLDTAGGIGADHSTTVNATSGQECLSACDSASECAAAVMKGITGVTSTPSSCVLLKGDSTPATFKRSMAKAVVTRLGLAALFN